MRAATTRRWAGGNTVNAATTASAEKRLQGFDVDFAAECESWEGSRSNGFFRSVPSGNSFIMRAGMKKEHVSENSIMIYDDVMYPDNVTCEHIGEISIS